MTVDLRLRVRVGGSHLSSEFFLGPSVDGTIAGSADQISQSSPIVLCAA